MTQNIFKELQEKKLKLIDLATKAAEYGWIPMQKLGDSNKDVISLEEIKEKLNKDTLTIGVIGQMKCGKSTFLNSFVFKDDVLPAATTPMTAALSVITYGEKERVVAEFYTKDEWGEQKMQASRDENEAANVLDESKIKAAKELVSKAVNLGTSLDSYLGKTQEDSFNNLIEYVGADGKYVSITKSVTIYYPHEYLKGVEVVDTPGFNDPIVSREERTKEFLKKADVVIMMLYAGRPFDATDRDIIFKNVRQCGIGKVLVGINKYDIPYCSETNPEDENQIKDYVKSEIRRACRDCNDNTLVEILNDVEPIPLSAEMALLSELPMSKISSTESLDFAWKRHCLNFGICSQAEMYKWSHLDDFVTAVKNMVDNEKNKILFAKPLNAIIAAGDKIRSENENELIILINKIKLLTMPDSDIEDREEKLTKVEKKIFKKIDNLSEDLNIARKGTNELEDIVDNSCNRLMSIIHNDWRRMKSFESVRPKFEGELDTLFKRNLKKATEKLIEESERKMKESVVDFFSDAEELLMRYLPELDSRDFVESIRNKIQLNIESDELFSCNWKYEDDLDWMDIIENIFKKALNELSFNVLSVAENIIDHGHNVASIGNKINSFRRNFDSKPFLDCAFQDREKVIDLIRTSFYDLTSPLQKQIQEIHSKKSNKEEELQTAEARRKELEDKKRVIAKQLQSISEMKHSI